MNEGVHLTACLIPDLLAEGIITLACVPRATGARPQPHRHELAALFRVRNHQIVGSVENRAVQTLGLLLVEIACHALKPRMPVQQL
jgi:hypothetical protein